MKAHIGYKKGNYKISPLTLIPLGYFEELSPLGGGGPDLGN